MVMRTSLFSPTIPLPRILYLKLGTLRQLAVGGSRKDVADFLLATADFDGDAIASLTEESISLLVDTNERLLAFA